MGVWMYVGSEVGPSDSPTTNSHLTSLDERAGHTDASAAWVAGFITQCAGLKSAKHGTEVGRTEPKGSKRARILNFYTCSGRFPVRATIKKMCPFVVTTET